MRRAGKPPRVVLVTRPTEYEELLHTHATRDQARFFLEMRGQSIEDVEARHVRFQDALVRVLGAVPVDWRRSEVTRADLDRFLFEPDDVVVALGQDGLVANLAKYLDGQIVVGLNPDPERFEGVLVPHRPADADQLLGAAVASDPPVEARTMVAAELDDGQRLLALNEIFVGHRSHQSARYELAWGDATEAQSSSGIIVASGTGSTGWARSIHRQRRRRVPLPGPTDARLAFFVREAWPSIATGTELTEGLIARGACLEVVSRMNAGGVVFGDGIETDRLDFSWGRRLTLTVSSIRLRLLAPVPG